MFAKLFKNKFGSPENIQENLLAKSSTISFADVAHQTIIFDQKNEAEALVLKLIDTKWAQRLRHIRQTGNTNLVYMFAEHSRFGHSLGVAYLATQLMNHLDKLSPEQVHSYRLAVSAAAILHDLGHTAPGSHLAERAWSKPNKSSNHEQISVRVIKEDPEIIQILESYSADLPETVCNILTGSNRVPAWTKAIISGDGWNADRGNWTIVDSAMCAVSYGRYNVTALIDAFRLSSEGELVIQENRLDALTHFLVARDSMYRQIYQHRVLQAADSLTTNLIKRLLEKVKNYSQSQKMSSEKTIAELSKENIFCDPTMAEVITSQNGIAELPLAVIFSMTDHWWYYHLQRWCEAEDEIIADLASRLRDRRLFKTIRLDRSNMQSLVSKATEIAKELNLDPQYYVNVVRNADAHRKEIETSPKVLLDNGSIVSVTEVEPMVSNLFANKSENRHWLAVPKEIKLRLGRNR